MNVELTDPKIVFFQDNQAAIRMGERGCGVFKHSKHIEHRTFLIRDHLEKDNMEFEFLDTDSMTADLLTKTTIRGAKLRQLTRSILNELEDKSQVMEKDEE